MIKNWTKKAIEYLEHSLIPIPQEINEIDWKESYPCQGLTGGRSPEGDP
jgi:hypothetical protein